MPRLVADAWSVAAEYSDARALGTLEGVDASLRDLVRGHKSAWRRALHAAAPELAAALPDRDARGLCRTWSRRWRGASLDTWPKHWHSREGGNNRFPVLSVACDEDLTDEPRPVVIFAVDGVAGVMEWNGLLHHGEPDVDKSFVFVLPENARKTYTRAEVDRLATSCFLLDPRLETMVELWRDVTYRSDFSDEMSYQHGACIITGIHDWNLRKRQDALCVMSDPRFYEPEDEPETDLMHLYGYLGFRRCANTSMFELVETTTSFAVSEFDNVNSFDQAAALLKHVLASSRESPEAEFFSGHFDATEEFPRGEPGIL